ncbi:MAG: hypothetical protein ACI9MJ_001891 [Alphaproteobacteria bacterium]|jgi:hypothetical protein
MRKPGSEAREKNFRIFGIIKPLTFPNLAFTVWREILKTKRECNAQVSYSGTD